MLKEEKIRRALGVDLPLTCLDVCDSTNLRLKEMCRSGDKRVQLLCADSQTNGRGRLGRSFHSPEGTGIYMSLLLPLPKDALPLTIRAAAAVCRAVEEVTGQTLHIKWVNDLFLRGKKVCGILAEAVENMAVLGIGLNVKMPENGFPQVPIAGALEAECEREMLIGRIAFHVMRTLAEDKNSILSFYRERMLLTGKEISFNQSGQERVARVLGVDDMGGLMVQTKGGTEILRTGEVSIGSNQLAALE